MMDYPDPDVSPYHEARSLKRDQHLAAPCIILLAMVVAGLGWSWRIYSQVQSIKNYLRTVEYRLGQLNEPIGKYIQQPGRDGADPQDTNPNDTTEASK